MAQAGVESLVLAEAAGEATPADLAELEAQRGLWEMVLRRLLAETDATLAEVRRLSGPERAQVVADFEAERARLAGSLRRLTGEDRAERVDSDGEGPARPAAGPAVLQASWSAGRVVAWTAGPSAAAGPIDAVRQMLAAAGASTSGWEVHPAVPLPDGSRAEALAAPVVDVLGWLVAVGADPQGLGVGPSVLWLGRTAAWAVELVIQGRMIPTLRQVKRRRGSGDDGTAAFSVRWTPALVDQSRLDELAASTPGAVTAFTPGTDTRGFARGVLAGMVDAICRSAAERLEFPAAPPQPRTAADMAEAYLSALDGSRFDASARAGGELAGRLDRWARPVTTSHSLRLIVQLDPPDDAGAWRLAVLARDEDGQEVPAEVALVTAMPVRRREVEDHLVRLERLVPALRRPGGHRRGEVILSQDEAWDLMSRTGHSLAAAAFDVRIPTLSHRRPTAALRLFAEPTQPSVVGAQQLAQVRWSAVFDDVELDAGEIARLAAEARPMVRSRGRWIALDHADLAAAAAALAERSRTTELSGAAMLRHALGLEGSPLAGGITVEGSGWAAELLRQASAIRAEPVSVPEGFRAKLRDYQAEALAWLAFLDGASLGGCLALDMGLGKTPTMLAHLLATAGHGPALVVAPPAVVGNWAAEAARFTPGLRVVVHHGSDRAAGEELATLAGDADVVLTTYGTAVRDVEALAAMAWDRMVIDEAQAIKNPASDTAQQLRRIPARTRVALTGTPIENGLGDLWAILDFTNPGLVGPRPQFVAQLSKEGDNAQAAAEAALRALNGLLVFRRTKSEPLIAAELPERIDELDHCTMTAEQIGLYQAVLDDLIVSGTDEDHDVRKGRILAAITALKQICNHPANYNADDDDSLDGRSGKLTRLEEIIDAVFAAGERVLVFTHFAQWGVRLADHLSARMGVPIACYHGGLPRQTRDRMVAEFQAGTGPGALVLSLKAGGTGLNLTAASHVVLFDRWWNPAVEDQARDRAWRIGQSRTVVCHRLVCPGTVDERVEEVVAGKRRIAELVLPKSSSISDLDPDQLRIALGIRPDAVLTDEPGPDANQRESAA